MMPSYTFLIQMVEGMKLINTDDLKITPQDRDQEKFQEGYNTALNDVISKLRQLAVMR